VRLATGGPLRRRAGLVLIAVMTLVTAWSIWAFAQQPRPGAPHGPGIRPAPPPHGPAAPPGIGGPTPLRPRPAPPVVGKEGTAEPREDAESADKPENPNWIEFGKVDAHGEPIPPYIAMLVNFGILIAGYYLLGRKPIAAALQSRRDNIAKEIEEAQRMRKEAEERAKVYQVKLAHLEEEVKGAREALVRAGEAERDRMVTEAEAKAERMRKDAEFLVQQELKQIRQDLWRDTVEAAVSAAEDLLKKRVTAADQERLAEDYLADLGGKKDAPPASKQESAS